MDIAMHLSLRENSVIFMFKFVLIIVVSDYALLGFSYLFIV